MADNITIVANELATPGTFGLNNITRTYTNPGGLSSSDPAAIAAIDANTVLINETRDIEVYRQDIPSNEFFEIFEGSAAALDGLSATEVDKYNAFVKSILNTGFIHDPEKLMWALVNNVIFTGVTGEDVTVRANYDALIRELKTTAEMIGANARKAVVVDAMRQLGWIV